ncbi:unnamed protein product [Sphagnum balticum]
MLVSALMTELESDASSSSSSSQCDFDRLVLSNNPFVESKFEFLIECMNDLSMEQAEELLLERWATAETGYEYELCLLLVYDLLICRVENAACRLSGEDL